jgi:hypothetical protein
MRRLNIFLLVFTMMALGIMIGTVAELKAQGGLNNPLAPSTERTVFYVGPVVGYNNVNHDNGGATFADNAFLDADACPTYTGGNANGFYVGLSGEYLLGGAKNSTSSIIMRVLYNTMPSSLKVDQSNPEEGGGALTSRVNVVDKDGNESTRLVESNINMYNEISYNLFTLEAVYKLNIGDTPFGIVAGPVLDFAITKTQREVMELNTADLQFKDLDADALAKNYRLEDGNTKYVFSDGDIDGSSSVRFALKLGAQYEFLFGKWYLVPSVYYNFGLTSLVSGGDQTWKVNVIQVGFDARYAW